MTDEEHVEQSADPGRTVVYCGGTSCLLVRPRGFLFMSLTLLYAYSLHSAS